MNGGSWGVLALLSDGLPHAAVEIFRQLYESRVSVDGLAADLPPSSGRGGRLAGLVDAGLVEEVRDRQNSYFLTSRGHEALREKSREIDLAMGPLTARLVREIEAEIGDAKQASMFAESRLANTWKLASDARGQLPGKAELLRFAMFFRLEHVLAVGRGAGHDFMKQVHDQVTDASYSRLMTLLHAGDAGSEGIVTAGLLFREVADGLEHAQQRTRSRRGPIFLNVLRVDPARRTFDVEDVSGRPKGERFITRIAERTRGLAVVSAGYFIYSEKGYEPPTRQFDPVGLCLAHGKLSQPPVFIRGSVFFGPDPVRFARVGLTDVLVHPHGETFAIDLVNVAPDRLPGSAIAAYNNLFGRSVDAAPGELLLTVCNGTVTSRDQGRALIPLNGFVLRIPKERLRAFRGLVEEVLPMTMKDPDLARATSAVAAGPMLLEDGHFAMNYAREDFQEGTPPVTFSGDRTIDRNLIPRCGIGTASDGKVLIAIVDGRQPHLSVGATLTEFASLLRDLGAVHALNLDGGGTAAMQVGADVVSNPSTSVRIDARGHAEPARTNEEKNVRPLATAIVVR
ncbi:MAG: phosphodiester glycosidase family protein [Acidobacteriota bacterium]